MNALIRRFRHLGVRQLMNSKKICPRAAFSSEQAGNIEITTDEKTSPVAVAVRDTPIITSRKLEYLPACKEPKQAWLETMSTLEDDKLGIIDLHPDIFSVYPRIDVLWENIRWQRMYRHIDYRFVRNRAEMPGGGRKPWPQKGTGRARHGSIRSPLWKGGGKTNGPRGPRSIFYMLSDDKRSLGLRTALSIKYAQADLHIVDSLDIPSDSGKYLSDLIESRGWGLSVLFIDDTDYLEQNFASAIEDVKQYNVMPVYGLNVYSMLKHETLVLTLPALERIEEKLLFQMHKADHRQKKFSRITS